MVTSPMLQISFAQNDAQRAEFGRVQVRVWISACLHVLTASIFFLGTGCNSDQYEKSEVDQI
jgi:hypothetical protein